MRGGGCKRVNQRLFFVSKYCPRLRREVAHIEEQIPKWLLPRARRRKRGENRHSKKVKDVKKKMCEEETEHAVLPLCRSRKRRVARETQKETAASHFNYYRSVVFNHGASSATAALYEIASQLSRAATRGLFWRGPARSAGFNNSPHNNNSSSS